MQTIEEIQYSDLSSFYDEIPVEGSLGILALGATGIRLWRKKKKEFELQKERKIR